MGAAHSGRAGGAAPAGGGSPAASSDAADAASAWTPPPSAALPPSLSALAPPHPAHPHPTHLVVLVHGIVGSPTNWAYITEALRSRPGADGRGFVVLPSAANSLERAGPRGTFEGVDVCGARVAAEVRCAVADVQAARAAAGAPLLDRVSVVGHSMGGLVARAAVAHLLEPSPGGGGGGAGARAGTTAATAATAASPPSPAPTLAGLRPVSFITIATPHAGCTGSPASAAAVPLVRWLKPPGALGAALDRPVAAAMGRTGLQFFLRDWGGGGSGKGGGRGATATPSPPTAHPPLLVRMASPTPGDLPYLPALAAFACRAAFANTGGDHLVGWANASLRFADELPALQGGPGGRGVVRDSGLASGMAHPLPPPRSSPAAEDTAPTGPGASDAERAEVAAILTGLRTLPWRRVDVCYRGAWHRGAAAHNLIQVTRAWCRWLDPEAGAAEAVCEALVEADGAVLLGGAEG